MNAVRSPEDIMPAIPPAGAAAPRVNPLQRIWLREIGMEKLWLKPAPAARQVDAQVVDLKGSVRPSGSGRTPGPGLAGRAARCSGAAGAGRARPEAPARVARPCAAARRPAGRQAGAGSRRGPGHSVAERVRNATLDELREQVVSCNRLRPVPGTPPRGLRPWRPAGALAGGGRGAGRTGRPPGPARRPFGPAARRHAVGRGHEPRARRVHRQRDQCRPPNRNPKPEEIAACSLYLMRQIELPARAHPGGPLAAQTLLSTGGHHRQPARPRAPAQDRRRPANPRDRQLPPRLLLRSPVEKSAPGKT